MNSIELIGAEQFKRHLSLLERDAFPTANARSLNKALTSMRTRTARGVAKMMGVKQKDVRARISLFKANPARQSATIQFKGSAFNLVRFKARQTAKGVSAAPWGKRRIYRHAFIATIAGARVVMVRQKRGGTMSPRLPIRGMLGPGIAKTANEDEMKAAREDVMRSVYPTELARQLNVLVARTLRR